MSSRVDLSDQTLVETSMREFLALVANAGRRQKAERRGVSNN